MGRRTPSTSRRGFTLAESLTASVVLALAVVGVSGAIIASQQQTLAQQDNAVAITLARQLMEEIASTPVALSDGTTGASGWPTVTNRALYDTVDDFNGYRDVVTGTYQREQKLTGSEAVNATSAKPNSTVIPSASSLPMLGSNEYLRTVSVSFPTSAFGTTLSSGDLAAITVTVTSGRTGGGRVQLSRIVPRVTVVR